MKLSIIVPTYNERENLPILVKELKNNLDDIDFELIIVDDNSPDGTWKIAEELAHDYKFLKVIRRENERDLATAVLEGFKNSNGDILVVMDADLQHPPEKILDMLKKINGADIVIGSRYIEGGEIEDWSIIRRIYSKFAKILAYIFVPKCRKVKDPLSGFFMLKREVIENTNLNPIGYKILLEILAKGNYRKVLEEPIKFCNRKRGKSSLNIGVQSKYIKHLLKLSWELKEFHRIIKFGIVGLSGIFVNLFVLWFLTSFIGIYYLYSAIFSIEASIISNFLLNDLWTFRDRRDRNWIRRLIKFNIISLPAFPMQISVMGILKEIFGVYYLMAAFIGIIIVFIWNFVPNTLWTWKKIECSATQ